MTGYGKAECLLSGQKYMVELRSLNSKQADINMRIAPLVREKELELRSIITQGVERGKIDCTIMLAAEGSGETGFTPLNLTALDYYVQQIQSYADTRHLHTDVLALAMRMPDVCRPTELNQLSDSDWESLQKALHEALERFRAFRLQEGEALQRMFTEKLNDILSLLAQVESLEKERIGKIRNRIEESLRLLSEETQQQTDRNRLEQEMIYYLEKLDITEEKVRLRNHIKYFFETMEEEKGVGKKLGFVAQEMGREINTLGSKSNHSEMQIIVVKMKDILEQIKEQVLNVL